jgi:N-methylhydantoinase A
MSLLRAATDVGGTFTDVVYFEIEESTGACLKTEAAKVDTVPNGFDTGVMNALSKAELRIEDLAFFVHGSTVVINTLTERKGAKTALITTAGFRDILEIGRGNRPDIFNFNFRKPAPFVRRSLRAELVERTDHRGTVLKKVELDGLPTLLEGFRRNGIESIAVCFLHAYANPENERQTVDRVRMLAPDMSVLASHEISREWREYERCSTTVLAAYVHPIAAAYLSSLATHLSKRGLRSTPYIMQSSGGMATIAAAKRNPIALLESGPASGVYAAAYLGGLIGEQNIISLDIGGTTAKCALIEGGAVQVSTDYSIERTRNNPGYPVQTPVVDLVEIGNGGGSIASLDHGGKLHVGPESAGAMPGPAAYGRGGKKPTTTDANLLLGRIDPEGFAGGEISPDWNAIREAFSPMAADLGVSTSDLARGIVRIANANMAAALRLVSTNKGHDPRNFVLMAFGGGGPMHAVALAEELRIPRVIVPVSSSVFSAWGMLLSDLRRDYVQTNATALNPFTVSAINRVLESMTAQAEADFRAELGDVSAIVFDHYADMRYQGQEHTVKVALSWSERGGVDHDVSAQRFHAAYERKYAYRLAAQIEIVNLHLVARIVVPKPQLPRRQPSAGAPERAVVSKRQVDFDHHGIHDATIYDGLRLDSGATLQGPAVIQEASATVVVPPGWVVSVDTYGNYHISSKAHGEASRV